jgi:hypothetical protein
MMQRIEEAFSEKYAATVAKVKAEADTREVQP